MFILPGLLMFAGLLLACTPATLLRGGDVCGPDMLGLHRDRYDIRAVCQRHDDCYGGALLPRHACDAAFRGEARAICAGGPSLPSRTYCRTVSDTFYAGIRLLGGLAYGAG